MKKKKILSLFMAVALIGAIGVGATLAYFTDTEETLNVVTMGHVDITLTEPQFDQKDGTKDNIISNIMPNTEIPKDPTVTVASDSEDAYVRMKLEIEADPIEGEEDMEALILSLLDIDTENWYLSEDGYYYYKSQRAAGESATLFTKVSIPETWGNQFANLGFNISVVAEAIQADNFEPATNDAGMITGWNYKDGTAITAENYEEPEAPAEATE